jgi:hypothetical protein
MSFEPRLDHLKTIAYSCFPQKTNFFTRTLARIPVFFIALAAGIIELCSKVKPVSPSPTISKTESVANELFLLLLFNPSPEELKKAKLSRLKTQINHDLSLSESYPDQMYQEGIPFNSQQACDKSLSSTHDTYLTRATIDLDKSMLPENEQQSVKVYLLNEYDLTRLNYPALEAIINQCETPHERELLRKLLDKHNEELGKVVPPTDTQQFALKQEKEREAFNAFGAFQKTQADSIPLSLETIAKFKKSSFYKQEYQEILTGYLYEQILIPQMIALDFKLKATTHYRNKRLSDFNPHQQALSIDNIVQSPDNILCYRNKFVINLESLIRPSKLLPERITELKEFIQERFHTTLFNSDLIQFIENGQIKNDLEQLIDEHVGSIDSPRPFNTTWKGWDFAEHLGAQREALMAYKNYQHLKDDGTTTLTLKSILEFSASSTANQTYAQALFEYWHQTILKQGLENELTTQSMSKPEVLASAFSELDFLNPQTTIQTTIGPDFIGTDRFRFQTELGNRNALLADLNELKPDEFKKIVLNNSKDLKKLITYLNSLVFDLDFLEKPLLNIGLSYQRLQELKAYLKEHYNCSTFNLYLIEIIEDPNVKEDLKQLIFTQIGTREELIDQLNGEKAAITAFASTQPQDPDISLTLKTIKEFETKQDSDKTHLPYLLKMLELYTYTQYQADYCRETTTVEANAHSYPTFIDTLNQMEVKNKTRLDPSIWPKLFAKQHFNQVKAHFNNDIKKAATLILLTTQALNAQSLASQMLKCQEAFENFKREHGLDDRFMWSSIGNSCLITKSDGSYLETERSIISEKGSLITKTTLGMELRIQTPFGLMKIPYILNFKAQIQEDGSTLVTTDSSGLDPSKAQMESM